MPSASLPRLYKSNQARNHFSYLEMEKPSVDHEVEPQPDQHENHAVFDKDIGVAIAATLQDADAVPDPWGPGYIRLYMICFIVYFCSTMNGELGRHSPIHLLMRCYAS